MLHDFVEWEFDSSTGYYYHKTNGFYYDQKSGFYYSDTMGTMLVILSYSYVYNIILIIDGIFSLKNFNFNRQVGDTGRSICLPSLYV